MKTQNTQAIQDRARQTIQGLRKQTKAQVFVMWCAACLGRIHCATVSEQRKEWMIYDIVRSKYGAKVADQVA